VLSGAKRTDFRGHPTSVHTVARAPDGKTFASADWSGFLKLWRWEANDVRTLFLPKTSYRRIWAESVSLSPDGAILLATGVGPCLYRWDVTKGARLPDFAMHHEKRDLRVFRALYAHGAPRLLVTMESGRVAVLDSESGAEVARVDAHAGDVRGLDVSPRDSLFATSGSDSLVHIWKLGVATPVHTLRGHRGKVYDVCFSPDGGLLASGSADGTVRLWDVVQGESRRVLQGHGGAVRDVAFSPDGRFLASACTDGFVRLWDVRLGVLTSTPIAGGERMFAVAFTHDGTRIAAGDGSGDISIIDPAAGREALRLHGHDGRVFSLFFAGPQDSLVSTSLDGTIRLWDALSQEGVGQARIAP
jgi:WD40 repeat protein